MIRDFHRRLTTSRYRFNLFGFRVQRPMFNGWKKKLARANRPNLSLLARRFVSLPAIPPPPPLGISKISKITHTGPTLLGRGFPRRRNSREDGSIERSRNRRGFMHNASILFSVRFRDTPRSIISRVNSTEPDNGDKRVSVPMIHGARSVSRRHSFQKNSFALVVASSRTHYTDEPINFRP